MGSGLLKVALTGATGFVGSHVLRALVHQPVEIVATYRGDKPPAGLDPDIQWLAFDFTQSGSDCYKILGQPDILIHLAWAGLPNYRSQHHTGEALTHQIDFLDRMIAGGLKHLTVTGTCFEYGMVEGELSETRELLPHLAYGEGKVRLFRHLEKRQNGQEFTLTWARLFYLYGEGQAESSLFSQFQKALSDGASQFNMSLGEQKRDFLEVSEAAEKIVSLALLRSSCGAVNVCSGRPISVRSLVEGWRRAAGSDIALNLGHYPYPDYEAMEFWGSDAKLRSLLNAS